MPQTVAFAHRFIPDAGSATENVRGIDPMACCLK